MVGVGDHVAHDVDGLVEADAVLGGEQTDELGRDHRGVRVVDLDDGVVGEVVQVASALERLVDDQLRGVAHHEVLLVDAQQAAVGVGVVGVEEQREVLCERGLVEVD